MIKIAIRHIGLFIILLVALSSCSVTKYVPDGKYLLNKVKLVSDDKRVHADSLKSYLRQTPNTGVFGAWKLQVNIYSLSGPDTTKRINRLLRKMGDAPEIYDSTLTIESCQQMTRALNNGGFYSAQVTYEEVYKRPKRVNVIYHIHSGEPYLLRNYRVDIEHPILRFVASDPKQSYVHSGENFSIENLDRERGLVAERMRERGYYFFEKDFISYSADSALNSRQVDVTMRLSNALQQSSDSLKDKVFSTYIVNRVFFYSIDDASSTKRPDTIFTDTIDDGRYVVAYSKRSLLRPKVMIGNCAIKPGELYNDHDVERTYELLNSLGPVRYSNISFRETAPGELTCYIVLTPNKRMTFQVEAEGTYSAGDWGVEVGAGYTHRNIFRGAEALSINAKAAYEWRQAGSNAMEFGGDIALKFPTALVPFLKAEKKQRMVTSTAIKFNYNYQLRPGEYNRTIAGAGIQYRWQGRNSRFSHTLDLVEFNYVYLPWVSASFREHFMGSTSILRYSYEDHFIMRIGYSGYNSNFRASQPLRNYRVIRYNIETAGNLLQGICAAANAKKDDDGAYLVGNIRFSQYVKADFEFTYYQIFNKSHRLVYHVQLGVGYPYGNASSLPFEKRYFAGGATGVRGWAARTLGPGTYRSQGGKIDVNNQTGDINLQLNVEYRAKLFWKIHGALFVDAGNIWTIRDYEAQPGGAFKWDSFYKEIALAYGAGLRLDFDYFVFRVDYGVKLYDPSLTGSDKWRRRPTWKNDMAFHFAINYPF